MFYFLNMSEYIWWFNVFQCTSSSCDTSSGYCKSCGTQSLTVSTPLSDQIYIVGDSFASLSYEFRYDYTGSASNNFCKQSTTTTYSITPSTSLVSVETTNRTVNWFTNNCTNNLGKYTITVTSYSNDNSVQAFTKFILTVKGPTIQKCACTTETIAITAISKISDFTYYVTNSRISITIPNFQTNPSDLCTSSDIYYTMTSSNQRSNFINFDTINLSLDWRTTNSSKAGTYVITINAFINTATIQLGQTDFTLTVIASCAHDTSSITLSQSYTSSNYQFNVGSSTTTKTIPTFQVNNAVVCTSSDIAYSFNNQPSFITKQTSTQNCDSNCNGQCNSCTTGSSTCVTCPSLQFTISSTTMADVETYTIQVIATLNAATTLTASYSFTITISPTCSQSTDSIAITSSNSVLNQAYFIGQTSQSITFQQFSVASYYCTNSDIVYTLIITPTTTSQSTIFISQSSSNQLQVTWQSSSNSDAGNFNIELQGQITNQNTQSPFITQTSFTLTVTAVCLYESNQFTITESAAIQDQTFKIGDAVGSITITKFTINSSTICKQTDILYSKSVQGPTGIDTSFIYFDSTTLVVKWNTASPSQVGQFIITITGSVQATNLIQGSTQFVLTITSMCTQSTETSITIKPSLVPDLFYTVASVAAHYTIPNFTVENSQVCTQDDIKYTILVTPPISEQSTSFIKISGLTVFWETTSNNDTGTFQLEVVGEINAAQIFSQSVTFSLEVIALQCSQYLGAITLQIPDILPENFTYLIGNEFDFQTIQPFKQNSQYCTDDDIIYSMQVTSDSGNTPSFIDFDATLLIVFWQTDDQFDADNYTIIIYAEINQFISNVTFDLIVIAVNSPPILQMLDQETTITYSTDDLTSDTLELGPIFDPENDEVKTSLRVIPSSNYFSFDDETGVLSFDLNSIIESGSLDGIQYSVIILLQDSNTDQPANTTYVLNFIVPANSSITEIDQIQNSSISKNYNNKTESSQNKNDSTLSKVPNTIKYSTPFWQTMKTDNLGNVIIYFSENFVIPPNISKIDSKVLNVKLVQSTSQVDVKYLNFTWNVTQYTNMYINLNLKFKNPLYISSSGKKNLDLIQVICLDNRFFVSRQSLLPIDQQSQIKKTIPPQLSSNQAANAYLKTLTSTMATSSKTVVIGTFIGNLFMSASLQYLWGMINSLQIIGNLPNLNINLPANAAAFFTFVNDISNFKVLPTDQIFIWLGLQSEINQANNELQTPIQQTQITSPKNQNQRQLSNKTTLNETSTNSNQNSNIFVELGPIFLMLLVAILFVFLLVIMRLVMSSIKIKKNFLDRIYQFLIRQLFWNATLRYIMESYISLSLNSLTLIYSGQIVWFTVFSSIQSLFSIISLAICLFTPITMTIYFRIKIKKFRTRSFLNKFGDVIENLNWRVSSSSNFISIFCYRRLVLVLCIILFSFYPYAQAQILTVSCLLVVMIFGYSEPLKEVLDTRLEFFNELTILFCVYHCFIFTSFTDNPESSYTMGFCMIIISVLNIAGNMGVMLVLTIYNFIFKFKVYRQKYRKWQAVRKFQIRKKKQLLEHKRRIEIENVIQCQNQKCKPAKNSIENQFQKRNIKRLQRQQETKMEKQLEQIGEVASELENENELINSQISQRLKQQSSKAIFQMLQNKSVYQEESIKSNDVFEDERFVSNRNKQFIRLKMLQEMKESHKKNNISPESIRLNYFQNTWRQDQPETQQKQFKSLDKIDKMIELHL